MLRFLSKIIKKCGGKPMLIVLKLTRTCTICDEYVPIYNMFKIHGCSHQYCYKCMKHYIEYKVRNESNVPRCPYENCNTKLNKIERYRSFLSFKAVNLLEERVMEDLVHVADRFYCPYEDCSVLMKMPKDRSIAKKWECIVCCRCFCIECRVSWHSGMTCDSYRRQNPGTGDDLKLKVLVVDQSWRQCPKCKHMIQHNGGCRFVKCRCGCKFCYKCGLPDGEVKCSCSWDWEFGS